MFWRIVRRLFAAQRGRLLVILLALGAGAALTAALLNIQVDAKRRLTKEFRAYFNKTWFAQNSSHAEENPNGYVAPPLDGIWASAPYFHNGSVPTIYGVLTQAARPKYFRRMGGAKEYDAKNIGLKYETVNAPAAPDLAPEARRRIVATTLPGLSNQGHPFGFKLSENEKWQVIEYLKTL